MPDFPTWYIGDREIGGYVMVAPDCLAPVDPDIFAYLEYEAKRRDISIQDVYQEEMDARRTASAEALSPGELRKLAENSTLSPHLLDGDEKCPF